MATFSPYRAFTAWGERPVSYTHLDVYKRQPQYLGDVQGNVHGVDNPAPHGVVNVVVDVGNFVCQADVYKRQAFL